MIDVVKALDHSHIVRHDDHGRLILSGDLGQELHHPLAPRGIESSNLCTVVASFPASPSYQPQSPVCWRGSAR
jgi:hypothetical protein